MELVCVFYAKRTPFISSCTREALSVVRAVYPTLEIDAHRTSRGIVVESKQYASTSNASSIEIETMNGKQV
jgi:hypothetical protein